MTERITSADTIAGVVRPAMRQDRREGDDLFPVAGPLQIFMDNSGDPTHRSPPRQFAEAGNSVSVRWRSKTHGNLLRLADRILCCLRSSRQSTSGKQRQTTGHRHKVIEQVEVAAIQERCADHVAEQCALEHSAVVVYPQQVGPAARHRP